MNSYIMPTYILTFRSPRLTGINNNIIFLMNLFQYGVSADLRTVSFSCKQRWFSGYTKLSAGQFCCSGVDAVQVDGYFKNELDHEHLR